MSAASRKRRPIAFWILLGAVLLILTILLLRQPHGPLRTSLEECSSSEVNCATAMIKKADGRWLGIVEISDTGYFHDIYATTEILGRIGQKSREKDALIVTFVHGWNHSAKEGDENLTAFEKLLDQLAAEEKRQRGENARQVLGLYVGWRGSSVEVSPFWIPTFWSRKAVAEDIGHSAVSVFATLNEIWAEAGGLCRSNGRLSDTRMLTIGHSFGGLIVSRAALPLLVKNVAEARGDGERLRGLGDLIVLINPAVEATAFLGLRSELFEYPTTRTKYPKLVVVTSDADLATRIAFPAGRLLTVWDRDVPKRGDWPLMLKTIGHADEYKTHDLTAKPNGPRWDGARQFPNNVYLADRLSESQWLSDKRKYSDTPFWLVKTDSYVVRDHSDFSDELRGFVGELFSDIAKDAASRSQACKGN